MSVIGAVLYVTLMQSAHDAADVIAHMLITDIAGIYAEINLAAGNTRNTTGIRMGSHIGGAVEFL